MNNKKFVFIVLFLSFLLTLLHYIYRLGIIDKIKSKQDLIAFDEGTVDIIKP